MTTPTKPHTGMRVSVAEFLELELPEPDDKRKMELDDGLLHIMSMPGTAHQFVLLRVIYHFMDFAKGFDEEPAVMWHPALAILSRERPRIAMPDLAFVLRQNTHIIVDDCVEGAPDIVAEILDLDRDRDLILKRQWYADAGAPEYWIFDWLNDTALQLELRGGQYVERAVLTANDTLTTPLLPGLAIPLADVFRHRSRPAR